jgi:protein-tyrosine phosphatase
MIMKELKRGRLLLQDGYWELRGRWVRNPPIPARPISFLFICKGNICRSPAAGQLAKEVIGAEMPAGSLFSSAGLEVTEPEESPKEAVQAGRNCGIHLRDHRSVRVTAPMIEAADMVFAMEVRQLKELRRRFPAYRQRLFLLPLFGNQQAWGYGRYNIRDPYGKSTAEFSRCFQNIRECLHNLNAALTALLFAEEQSGVGKEADLPDQASNW